MKRSKKQNSLIAYRLTCRFEGLIESVETLSSVASDLGPLGRIRYKPLFANYNSCVEEFKAHFPEEHAKLGLEELPLYDTEGKERFTSGKLSTLLHQSKAIMAALKGLLPPTYDDLELPSKVTLSWLSKHVPAKFWVWFAGLLFVAFSAGVSIDRFWIGRSDVEGGFAMYPQKSGKPELEIYYQGNPITGEVQTVHMSTLQARGDIALYDVYVQNVGDAIAEGLSVKFYIPRPDDQSVLKYSPGVISFSDWFKNKSLVQEYPTFLSLPYSVSLSPLETWRVPSFDITLANDEVRVVTAKLQIFYGTEKPAEADFTFHLKDK